MERMQLFGFPLGIYQIDEQAPEIQNLAEEIEMEEARSRGVSLSNRGGWQSEKSLFERETAAFGSIKGKIFEAFEEFLKDVYGTPISHRSFALETWANVNYRGHFNASHDHTAQDNHWSGVLYLRTGLAKGEPTTGITVFENRILTGDGRYISTVPIHRTSTGPHGSKFEIVPHVGRLLFFPGTLRHYVTRFEGLNKRITVAFNIRVKGLSNYSFDRGSLRARALSYMSINFRGLILVGSKLKRRVF